MNKRWTKMLSGLLCVAMLAATAIPASAASYPTSESGKTADGVSYTIKYPKFYGFVTAEIRVVDDSWNGDGQVTVKSVKLPVVASGDAFVLTLTGGLTSARCPDCDKPYPDPNEKKEPSSSSANMDSYDGPCIHPIMVDGIFDVNGEYNTEPDTFEWICNDNGYLSETPNIVLLDYKTDSVGLRQLKGMMIDPDPDFQYAPENIAYRPGAEQRGADAYGFNFQLGYYLRLPKATIDKMDFSKTYNTKELESLIKGNAAGKTRPLDIKFTNQVDLDNGVGYDYTLTNTTNAPIKGYYAFISYIPSMVQGKHSPANFVGQAHSFDVDLQPGESVSGSLTSCMYGMSTVSLIWVTFEDKAERDAFFSDAAFTYVSGNSDGAYHRLDGYDGKGVQFMKDKFGITIQPVK